MTKVMIRHFLKISFRNIIKYPIYSIINIFGLAIGLAAFLYIATYSFHEISFDSFHSKADRIYRVVSHVKMGETREDITRSELPLATAAKNDLPEVEASVRLYPEYNINTIYNEKKFIEPQIWYSDPNVFDVFDFKLLDGNPRIALSKPNTIILTVDAARKYFDNEDPIGKTLLIGNKEAYTVTGILAKIPENSHLQFDMLASFSSLLFSRRVDDWGNFDNTYTYIVVKEGVNIEEFEKKFDNAILKYEEAMLQKYAGMTYAQFKSSGNYFIHKLQPLQCIHLNSTFSEESKTFGNIGFLIVLAITGILILIIACFNFINLSTARASLRAKEIGLKKVMGSMRKTIIYQVLTETFIYCSIALILSILLLIVTLPILNNYSETIIKPYFFLNPLALLTIITIPIIVTLLAGSYPAFYITSVKPIDAIKNKFRQVNYNSFSRGGLVTFQFIVFIIMVFSAIIIRKQINFLHKQNPGFAKENVIVVRNAYFLGNDLSSFKTELLKIPSVISASYSTTLPAIDEFTGNPFGRKGSDEKFLMDRMKVDCDFQKTLKVELKDGRFFSENIELEKQNAIINEEAAKILGWTDCNDKILHDYNNGGNDLKVIAIVKDFHLTSLREKAKPLVMKNTSTANYLALRVLPENLPTTVQSIKQEWENINQDASFEYFFLDQAFDAQYKSEDRLARIIGLFTVIAILIASVGLFGLVMFTANQRRKEISIRKINGAKVTEVLTMLNFDLIKWVTVAFIIACPIAWYAMYKWLEGFAYKTELSWWIFAVAGAVAMIVALLTVSWQSWRAATRNPVEALRYE